MRPVKNVENLIWLRCKLRHIDVLKRVYSEICVIRVQIFILVSLLCEFVTFRRKKGLDGHLRERLTFLAQELEKITADLPVWG